MLKAKLHRATVTDTDMAYAGSITIDSALLAAAGIREYEAVLVANVNTGARFETYTIAGKAGSGEIKVNGAAARLAAKGDLLDHPLLRASLGSRGRCLQAARAHVGS